jgi:hypothetical protein
MKCPGIPSPAQSGFTQVELFSFKRQNPSSSHNLLTLTSHKLPHSLPPNHTPFIKHHLGHTPLLQPLNRFRQLFTHTLFLNLLYRIQVSLERKNQRFTSRKAM